MIGKLRLFQGVCAVLQNLHNAAVCAATSIACTCGGSVVCIMGLNSTHERREIHSMMRHIGKAFEREMTKLAGEQCLHQQQQAPHRRAR